MITGVLVLEAHEIFERLSYKGGWQDNEEALSKAMRSQRSKLSSHSEGVLA